MRIRPSVFAVAAMLAAPGLAFAQSTTTSPARAPAAPSTMNPVNPASPSTAPMRRESAAAPATTTTTAKFTTKDDMMRASKMIGATVYNDQNQSVGSVDELLIDNHEGVSGVVLSVGGFLGINSKLVKVSPKDIKVTGDKLVMSGASKDQLEQMPEYKIVPANAS